MSWLTLLNAARKVPVWAYAAVLVALVVVGVIGAQANTINRLERDVAKVELALANEQKARARETAQRAEVVAQDARDRADRQAEHNQKIMENDNEWRTKLGAATRANADQQRTILGLRRDRETYVAAASRNREGETDAAALARARDQLQRVSAMGERCDGLLGRSTEIVRQRDIEVTGLLTIIKADRAACEAK